MYLDHAVLWVNDVKQALTFYTDILGLEAIRAEEYVEGKVRFPSVRLNENTIFDLMDKNELLPLVQKFTGGDNVGGAPLNHLCLAMSYDEYKAISTRLVECGVTPRPGGENVFGAQGYAVRSVYFNDPSDNVIEIRYYEEAAA